MLKICKLVVLSFLVSGVNSAIADENDHRAASIGRGDAVLKADATNAVGTEPPIFKFGGFGTLGISHSSQSLGDYVLDGTMPKGPGRSRSWSANNDSRIGVQVAANFTPEVSAILQVISEYQADSTYRPAIEWANVKYAFTQDAYIRVGRIALPTFLNSDSRKVGYSYPWIHPPVDLYRQLSLTNSDGMDVSYRFSIGDAGNSIKLIYGRNTNERPASTSTSRNLWGIFDAFEYGPSTLRIGYQERESSSYNHLTGVTGAWIKNSDLSIGASYDSGDWFAMAEWMQRKSTTKVDAMYVSTGYRINKITPYLVYSQNSPASFLPGFPAPTTAAIQSAKRQQNTTSMGVRWDCMKNTDFKLQYDQVRLSDNSNGYLANLPAGVTLYGTGFHVVSAVLDFVF